jgi:hypothetical protein
MAFHSVLPSIPIYFYYTTFSCNRGQSFPEKVKGSSIYGKKPFTGLKYDKIYLNIFTRKYDPGVPRFNLLADTNNEPEICGQRRSGFPIDKKEEYG